MKYVFILVAMVITKASFAQDSISVNEDARIHALKTRQIIQNKRAALLSRNTKMQGYRIQVISTQNREEAFKVKAQLMENFPSQKSYTIFQAPYFRVKIGNFTNRTDAEIVKKSLSKMFKQNIYIVRDMIEYSPTEEELLLMQE